MNIGHLKKALPEGADHDEILPHEMSNEGTICVYAPDWKAWKTTQTNCMCLSYYSDDKGGRSDTIAELIKDIKEGLEAASQDTIDACGWKS